MLTKDINDIETIAKIIKRDCNKFLIESDYLPMYKGVKDKQVFKKFTINKNKISVYVGHDFFKGFADGMLENGFKAIVNNSVFCSGDKMHAKSYGKLHLIFMINDFKFSYSKEYIDWLAIRITSKNMHKYTEGKKRWNIMKKTYSNIYLTEAIKSKCEIMLTNDDGYYSVYSENEKYEKDLFELLK